MLGGGVALGFWPEYICEVGDRRRAGQFEDGAGWDWGQLDDNSAPRLPSVGGRASRTCTGSAVACDAADLRPIGFIGKAHKT